MQRENWSISFRLGGKRFVFAPNQNFWSALLFTLLACAWLFWGEAQEYWRLRQYIASVHLGGNPENAFSIGEEEGMALFSPKLVLAGSALISFLVRGLVGYLLKINKIMLLSQGHLPSASGTLSIKLGGRTLSFPVSRKLGYGMILTTSLAGMGFLYFQNNNEDMRHQISTLQAEATQKNRWIESQTYKQDVMGDLIDYFQQHNASEEGITRNYRDAFMMQKQLLMTQFLLKEKVSRVDMLSNPALLEMNRRIRSLFVSLILDKQQIEAHVYDFLTDTSALDKLSTALMEQAKYHVPASVKLAQAALETGYGKRVIRNNYFGIKDKTEQAPAVETVEYFNEEEVKLNQSKIVSKQRIKKGGKELYQCKVRDSFSQYGTPWESFRAHSLFLKENGRYHALFVEGKNYEAWAEKIGSTKYGGVGYATSPVYGQLLKQIIKRYNLYLLDQ